MGGTVRKVTGEKGRRKEAARAEAEARAQIDDMNKKARRREVSMAQAGSAALRSRRRGFRSLLGRAEEGQTGLSDKLGG